MGGFFKLILFAALFISPVFADPPCSRVFLGKGFNQLLEEKTPLGPRLVINGVGEKRSWEQLKELKISSYNVENLFLRHRSLISSRKNFALNVRTETAAQKSLAAQKANHAYQLWARDLVKKNPGALVTPPTFHEWLDRIAPAEIRDNFLTALKGEATPDKAEEKIKAIAEVIRRENPDIMTVIEVDDIHALSYLNDTYLDGAYYPILIEGNDSRGIDIGILVKKDLPFDLEVQSHREVTFTGSRELKPGDKVFSRDLPVLRLRKMGAPSDEKPFFAIVGTHYKSQGDAPGDPLSVIKRTQQVQKTVEILTEEYERLGIPFEMMGDYNGQIGIGHEFDGLFSMGMKDAFDMVTPPISGNDRMTHAFFPSPTVHEWHQLDGILFSKQAQRQNIVKSAHVSHNVDMAGNPVELPLTEAERESQATDHRMITVVIDMQSFK